MEFVESNFELLACGEPCVYHHPPPPLWTGKSVNPKCVLHTLVRIMKDPMSQDQIKRQMYLLEDLRTGLTSGFWLQDITNSMKLIQILLSKSDILPEYFDYAQYFIKLMRFPPLLCRTNEILDYEKEVEEYFSFFGYILVLTPKLSVRKMVIRSLGQLLSAKESIMYSMPWEMMRKHIELSTLAEILSQYLELCSNDVYFELVDIVWRLSNFSSALCLIMMKYGAMHATMTRLDANWQAHLGGARPQYDACDLQLDIKNYPLDNAIMLIHRLLNAYQRTPNTDVVKNEIKPPAIEALWGLRFALHAYAVKDALRNERNFVAALWLLFVECFPDAKHVQSGIVHDFAMLACFGDKIIGGRWASILKCQHQDNEDFDFKRSMMMGVILCADCLGAGRIYQDEDVVPIMCQLLVTKLIKWAPQFHEPLKMAAMLVLQRTVINNFREFLYCGGHTKLCNLLQELVVVDSYEPIYELFMQALKLTWTVLNSHKSYYLTFDYLDSQRQLQRSIFEKFEKYDFKLKNQKLMAQALFNMCLLKIADCSYDINLIVNLMERVLNPRPKDVGYVPQLMIAAICLLWKYGLHDPVNMLYFIKLKGVYLLLDLIKDAGFPVRLISLGYLVDLLDEESAIPLLVTWQKDGATTLSLMLQIFRQENEKLGVLTLPRGVIADPKFPLMGLSQKREFDANATESSPSVTDMFLSCRPKIYAILQMLSSRYAETLDIINEYYKIYDSNLSTDDKITKLLCENFLSLKIGEVWMEVDACVRPIEPAPQHVQLLDEMQTQFIEWGENIQKMQNKWLKIEQKNEHYTEEEFYNLLRETKLGPAIEGLAEMKYLARSSNAEFRKSLVSDTTPMEKGIIETHKTLQSINNYHAFAQKLVIQSDVIVDPFAPIPPTPVSEDDDQSISLGNESMSDISLPEDINCKDYLSGTKVQGKSTEKRVNDT